MQDHPSMIRRFLAGAGLGLAALGCAAHMAVAAPVTHTDEGPIFSLTSSGDPVLDRAWRSYILKCVGCHQADGSGLPEYGIPNFVDRIGVFAGDEAGRHYLINVPNVIGSGLDAEATAEIMNFIVERWANDTLPADWQRFTPAEIARHWQNAPDDIVAYRRNVAAHLQAAGVETPEYPWP